MKNETCDICGYWHPKPDNYAIVIRCGDGLYRCKVCRGAGKFNAKRVVQALAALPQDDQEREDAIAALKNAGSAT